MPVKPERGQEFRDKKKKIAIVEAGESVLEIA